MKILMLAPEPFFQPRGTPISVYFRNTALSALGHEIDLLTYPLGKDVEIKNLTILRIPNFLRFKSIKIGPSMAKLPLDAALLVKACGRLLMHRYDIIFSHEEAAFFGAALGRLGGIPHIYDMHSSLPQQLENFQFSRSRLLKKIFARMERFVLKNSQAIIVICPDLMNRVREEGFDKKAILIENVLDFPPESFSREDLEAKKREIAPNGEKIVLYAGNFGPYQGIDLLLEAAALVREQAVFLLVGGNGPDTEALAAKAAALGIRNKVFFQERVKPEKVAFFLELADVLVSPRMSGTNTPLKIYSFLKSGKPLVATRLMTHTQVLDDKISVLVDPTPPAMAEGIRIALSSEDAARRAAAAKSLAEREYTFQAYLGRMERCLEMARGNRKS